MNTIIIAIVLCFYTGCALSQYESIYVRPNARGVPYEKTRQEIVNNFLTSKPLLNYVPVYTTEYGHWNPDKQDLEKTEPVKKSRADPQMLPGNSDSDSDLAYQEPVKIPKTNLHMLPGIPGPDLNFQEPLKISRVNLQMLPGSPGPELNFQEPVQTSRANLQMLPGSPTPDLDFQKLSDVITRLKTDMQELSHQTKHAYEDKLKELTEVQKLHEDLKIALQNTDELKNSLNEHERQLNELTKNIQDRNEYPGVNPSGLEEFLNMIESLELMVRNISYKYGGKLGM